MSGPNVVGPVDDLSPRTATNTSCRCTGTERKDPVPVETNPLLEKEYLVRPLDEGSSGTAQQGRRVYSPL